MSQVFVRILEAITKVTLIFASPSPVAPFRQIRAEAISPWATKLIDCQKLYCCCYSGLFLVVSAARSATDKLSQD